jgi:ubiquitin carboxyl-terminal hydrolase 14
MKPDNIVKHLLLKGASVKDDSWDSVKAKIKPGATFLLMGSKEEDIPAPLMASTQFIEDMDESELQAALKLPAGLTNLGNTCYMNATIQCLKTVPEFCQALTEFKGNIGGMGGADHEALSVTAALRDLYRFVGCLIFV